MFDLFDLDHRGSITVDNIKKVLGGGRGIKGHILTTPIIAQNFVEDAEFERILDEVDMDGDGEISFDEFREMIKRIFQADEELDDNLKISANN